MNICHIAKIRTPALACMFVFVAMVVARPWTLRADEEHQAHSGPANRAEVLVFNPGLEQAIQALAKSFCIELRDNYSTEPLTGRAADKLRHYFDPEYLKKHDLEVGDLPILTTPFRRLDDIRVSDDLQTVFCVVDNDSGRKEVILVRVVIEHRDDRYSYAYIRPANPPDPDTGFFAPWVLKVEISDKPARGALPVPGASRVRTDGDHSRIQREPKVKAKPQTNDALQGVGPRLYRIILPVADIERAATIYAELLGIEGERVSPGRHYFNCSGTILACYDSEADSDGPADPPRYQLSQYIYFSVSDLDTTYATAIRLGFTDREGGIKSMPWGERMFWTNDPFGNPVSFVAAGTEFLGPSDAKSSAEPLPNKE